MSDRYRYSIILDAYYDTKENVWIFPDELEKLCQGAADVIRQSIQREVYLQYRRDNPLYLTAVS